MNLKNYLLFIFIGIICSFKTSNVMLTPKQLGQEVFNCIRINDKVSFLKLQALSSDIEKTIDNLKIDTLKRSLIKKDLVSKLEANENENKESLLEIFNLIHNDIVKGKSKWKITQVKPEIDKLKSIEIELGKLTINYLAAKKKRAFEVKIINTVNGWKMLEKPRLIDLQ